MKSTLVQTNTKDGLFLQGYFTEGPKDKPVLLHIHGYAGNFYENSFVHNIDKHIVAADLSFLSVNTRGCEYIKEFNTTHGGMPTIGARYELLEEAYRDIDAWIKFLLDKGYKEVILQGHSLGTIKAVRYLSEGNYSNNVKKLILLAPFDKKGLLEVDTKDSVEDLMKKAKSIVSEGRGKEVVTEEFETIDVCYETWISWYKQDELGRMFEFCSKDYDFPALKKINIPVKVIVGTKDEYFHQSNPENPKEAKDIMEKHIRDCVVVLLEGATHSYKGFEDSLSEEIVAFIN